MRNASRYTYITVVVGPTPSLIMVDGSNINFMALRMMVSSHLVDVQTHWLTVDHLYSSSTLPTSTGAVNKSVTLSCVFILVQLNKCVVVCVYVFAKRAQW